MSLTPSKHFDLPLLAKVERQKANIGVFIAQRLSQTGNRCFGAWLQQIHCVFKLVSVIERSEMVKSFDDRVVSLHVCIYCAATEF